MISKGHETMIQDMATRFSKILVVCSADGHDEELLRLARDRAQAWGAGISVLTVIEPPSGLDLLAQALGGAAGDVASSLRAEHMRAVSAVVDKAAPDLSSSIEVREGKVFIEIIRHVMAHGYDLVIKTAEELEGLAPYFFTSTDQHLLRKCPVPVWLHVAESMKTVKTVLAAVDVDLVIASEPETLAGLNQRILDTAEQIAFGSDAVVYVVHVWDAPAENLVRGWSGSANPAAAARAYVNEVQATRQHALDGLIAARSGREGNADTTPFVPRLKRGDPRQVLPSQVRTLKADVLVMGTVAHTGVPGFIIGNTAEDILNSVDCSVITVKPPGYTSPIHPA